jgi:hypothetical protein
LLATATKKASEEEDELMKKYLTGDLGDGMSADLNYALKRLVKGLTSEAGLFPGGEPGLRPVPKTDRRNEAAEVHNGRNQDSQGHEAA